MVRRRALQASIERLILTLVCCTGLPLKAKMLSVREAFNKKISSTEQFLKVQTEANVELANRIKDLVPASQIFSRVSPPAP